MDFERKVRKIKIKSPGRKESRRFFYDEVKWLDFFCKEGKIHRRYVFVIVPAAFALSRIVGVTGVWHAFWVTEIITAVISAVVYRRAVS